MFVPILDGSEAFIGKGSCAFENCRQGVVVSLSNRIEFVIVTTSATKR